MDRPPPGEPDQPLVQALSIDPQPTHHAWPKVLDYHVCRIDKPPGCLPLVRLDVQDAASSTTC